MVSAQQIMHTGLSQAAGSRHVKIRDVSTSALRILLVAHDRATRDRITQAVSTSAVFNVIAAVGTQRAAEQVLGKESIDVLLIDPDLPDGGGCELIKRVQSWPGTYALVVTVLSDERHVVSAIQAGASGYLLKQSSTRDITNAILDMQQGGFPISPAIAPYLVKHFRPQPEIDTIGTGNKPELTRREKQVIEFVAKGFTYSEIAQLLDLSIHTVTSHIKNTYKKLSVGSRGEAVYEAVQLGLVHMEANLDSTP